MYFDRNLFLQECPAVTMDELFHPLNNMDMKRVLDGYQGKLL
jgi:hypothetical protein